MCSNTDNEVTFVKKKEFADRLSCACASVISAEQELIEIDSHFVDADHGLTMKKLPEPLIPP